MAGTVVAPMEPSIPHVPGAMRDERPGRGTNDGHLSLCVPQGECPRIPMFRIQHLKAPGLGMFRPCVDMVARDETRLPMEGLRRYLPEEARNALVKMIIRVSDYERGSARLTAGARGSQDRGLTLLPRPTHGCLRNAPEHQPCLDSLDPRAVTSTENHARV